MARVLELVGFVPTQRRGDQLYGPCPLHGSQEAADVHSLFLQKTLFVAFGAELPGTSSLGAGVQIAAVRGRPRTLRSHSRAPSITFSRAPARLESGNKKRQPVIDSGEVLPLKARKTQLFAAICSCKMIPDPFAEFAGLQPLLSGALAYSYLLQEYWGKAEDQLPLELLLKYNSKVGQRLQELLGELRSVALTGESVRFAGFHEPTAVEVLLSIGRATIDVIEKSCFDNGLAESLARASEHDWETFRAQLESEFTAMARARREAEATRSKHSENS